MSGKSIEAVLRLETTPFVEALTKTKNEVNNFRNSLLRMGKDSPQVEQGVLRIQRALSVLIPYLKRFANITSETKSFSQFARGLKQMSEAVMNFSNVTKTSQVGMIRIKEIISQWSNAVRNLTVSVRESTNAERQQASTLNQLRQAYAGGLASQEAYKNHLTSMNNSTRVGRQNLALYHQNLRQLAMGVEQFNAIETNGISKNNSYASSLERTGASARRTATQMSSLSNQTSRLGKAMSSLRMIGSLVGSMLAYNFAHKLLVATGETIHAKSEMEGYFKMLNFGQGEIDHFNKALDNTVSQFQRVNKYSLGETISSIGVEFNLTTQEMEKAMKVTSMVTSEYLRAGRNANEASLAVKDVLQGQFQRLSRETGVGKDELEEAGWNGDTTDVLSLMEALEKVGESRHWDVFAEKANSLNDILTISQNRFGEWAADMVNIVQPSIVNAFNSIMTVAGGLSEALGGFWEWLNGGSWGAIATQIGIIGTAILTVSQALTMYRTGMSMVEVANLGVTKTLATVVLGLKGQEVAEIGVRNAILSKILGVKAETLAESGVATAIQEKTAMMKLETVENKLNAFSSKENSLAKMENALQTSINKAELEGLITAEQAKILTDELNTVSTEANTIASLEQVGVNGGLTATFIALGGAENVTAVATGEVSVAMGVLNGVFSASPIGWITVAVIGLATALYGLSGGFDSVWGSLQNATKAVEDASSATKPYRDYVEDTNKELQEAKEKYGENSIVVQQLSEKYDRAKYSLDGYYKKLQDATSQHGKLNGELGVTSAKMDEIMRAELGDVGFDNSEIDNMVTGISELDRLRDHDYTALQKHSAMLGNFSDNVHKFAEVAGDDTEAIQNFGKTYYDFISYSDKANTADNWWDWFTNSVMAGVSAKSLDIQKLAKGMWDTDDPTGDFLENFGLKGITDSINQWLESLPDPVSELQKWVSDTFGNIDLGKMISDWFSGENTGGMQMIDIPSLLNNIFGLIDSTGITEWFNTSIATPIGDAFNNFMADPLSALGGFVPVDGVGSLLNILLPSDGGVGIWDWVNNTFIVPMNTSLYNGIMSIPLVSDILALFGLVNGENSGASQKGTDIGNAFKTKVEEIVRNIPILGDVLAFLGVIPQANPTASSNGQGVGKSITDGVKNGMNNLGSMIIQEFQDALNGIGQLGDQAYRTAQSWANQLWEGVNSILQRASPGFFHDQFKAEFGTDIPNAIDSASTEAYTVGQNYATQIREGVSSVSTSVGFGGMVDSYEADAQIIADSSQLVGTTTTTAFNDMSLAVNQTTATMGTNVVSAYSTMQQKQSSSLNSMKTQNMTAYNEMYQKSNQSLIQMRDSTTNLTHQMTDAWTHMKNQIVATANRLKTDATVHFNTLSNTIGSFYRKIQNPSSWGSAGGSQRSTSRRNTRVGRAFSSAIKHGAGGVGGTGYTPNSTMTIASLKRKLCPNGECGDLFDGFGNTEIVNVSDFLSMISEGHGFGSWSGWNTTHYNHIKNKSDAWTMKSPTINLKGGIPTNANYKVGDFENGTPKISFSSFQSMAESIFSAIPYRFYYDSSWKGSWLGALQAGACNCVDGANALVAFASTCGFGGHTEHGTWVDPDGTTYPHVFAVINGKKMDTTGWQQRRSWSAGSPNIGASKQSNNQPPVNITVNVENAYGIDDLNSQIEEGIDRGLEKHFNKSYALGV